MLRRLTLATGALVLASGTTVVLLVLASGIAPQTIPGLSEPGVLSRYAVPVVQPLRDLSAALTIGVLVLAACCVPPQSTETRERVLGARRHLARLAAPSAVLWSLSSLALIAFNSADADGSSALSDGAWSRTLFFARHVDLGRYLVAVAVVSLLVAIGATLVRRTASLGLLAVVAILALWPMVLGGHREGRLSPEDSVNLQAAHLLGVSVWFGGLGALILVRHRLGAGLVPTIRRYSTLAGASFALVALSGLLAGALRLPGPGALASSYGVLLGLKTLAIVILSAMGWWHRSRLIDRLASGEASAFWRIAGVEVAVLSAAVGVAVALNRSEPPEPAGGEPPLSAMQALLGYDLPPPLGAVQWIGQWRPDLFWMPIAVGALGCYAVAVQRRRARDQPWPVSRTLAWVLGCLLLLWATSGAPGAYSRVLLSMHFVQLVTVATAVPLLLVLGAPATLALQTLPRRTDASMGRRAWLVRIIHSPTAYALGHPLIAAVLLAAALASLTSSSVMVLALRTHTAHLVAIGAFLTIGYLLASALVGTDPGPPRPSLATRGALALLLAGVTLLVARSVAAGRSVAGSWYDAVARPWGVSSAEDQRIGAVLIAALGATPWLVVAVVLLGAALGAGRRRRRPPAEPGAGADPEATTQSPVRAAAVERGSRSGRAAPGARSFEARG